MFIDEYVIVWSVYDLAVIIWIEESETFSRIVIVVR